ncbi:MAG TPA: 3-methyl-2-oxobutanoate hydroxymethyltransferase [Bacillota bacterium]|nr:3-methyl-2-oxobutanoate hydroxymethyltransferase [Bacillota bacterium]
MEQIKVWTTSMFRKMKENKEPIVMVTAYDFPTAKLAEEAGAEMLLVGDSLGMVVLGYESTVPVTLDDMLHHTKAVTRGAKNAFVISDLPFLTYHGSIDQTLLNAGRLMQEGLAKAVKLEGGKELAPTIKRLVTAGIPVVGHIGLTPQSVHQLGGYKVQGKTAREAQELLEDALAIEEAGAFSIVLECVPSPLAELITSKLSIPTIGIGAGPACDGQVLVFHDLVQYASSIRPKFVKSYANLGEHIQNAISNYAYEVKHRIFPGEEHSFGMKAEAIEQLYGEKVSR